MKDCKHQIVYKKQTGPDRCGECGRFCAARDYPLPIDFWGQLPILFPEISPYKYLVVSIETAAGFHIPLAEAISDDVFKNGLVGFLHDD